jgi:hypothetical protein
MLMLAWGVGEVEVSDSVRGYDIIPHIGNCSTDSGERVVRKTFAETVEAVTAMTFISEDSFL